jgi:pyruvate dehydrogenase E2 component (dihydrolipoamide acetyltransferase)
MSATSTPEPLSRLRRAIVKSLNASAAIPQFAVEMVLDAGPLIEARGAVTAEPRPSYSDAIVASVAAALRDHRSLNASLCDEGIVRHEEINVAFAVALDGGLVSPAIEHAEQHSLRELAAERVRLTEAAHGGTLTPRELLSATFTISNLGPLGVRRFNALVIPPQVAILAVGALEQGEIALTLSVDHRVVDGAPAAEFLGQIRSQLGDREWLRQRFVDASGNG